MSITTVPYDFNADYCAGFSDLSDNTESAWLILQQDFRHNLCRLLEALHVPASSAYCITESLFARMTDSALHYHTPIHILSIFQFVKEKKIRLAWWEEIALWFHDAIYVPGNGPGANEWASSKFMEAMLCPYLSNVKLTQISMAIHHTALAYHLSTNVPSKYHLLLDLDLCNYAFPNPGEENSFVALLHEYLSVYKNDETALAKASQEFLSQALISHCLYRTKAMEPFQMTAIDVAVRFLKHLGRIIQASENASLTTP